MDDLLRDVRFTLRTIVKKPTFALVAVLSLALGIGANAAIFSLINEIFLRPLPFEEPSQVMQISTADERAGNQSPLSHLNWVDVREQNNVFSGVASYDFNGVSVSSGGEPTVEFALMVSANYFDVLGVVPQRGRFFLAEEQEPVGAHPVVVLHHDYWTEELGGDEAVLGTALKLNGTPFTVVGIAPPEFNGVNVGVEPALWVPSAMNPAIRTDPELNWYEERRGLFLFAVGRLKPGVSQAQAQAEMDIIAERLEREYPDDNQGRGLALRPITETAIFNRDGVAAGSTMLMATVGLVLLIACANVANLLLARATERRNEIALRLALGVGRGRLVRQLLTESVLVSLLGGAMGIGLAYFARERLAAFLGNVPGGGFNLALDLAMEPRVLLFALVLSVLTGLLFGLVPALQASRPELVQAIKSQTAPKDGVGRRINLRNGLVVVQLALSVVALVGAGLFVRSLGAAQEVDLGYETDDLAVIAFDVGLLGYGAEEGRQFFRETREMVAALPGVERVALAQAGPLQGTITRSVLLEGESPEERTYVQVNGVGPGYFETMGVAVEEGRSFEQADRDGSVPVVVVNRAMADRYWPNQRAVGKRFSFFGMEPVEVVGVAETVKIQNPGEDPQPYAYLPTGQYFTTGMTVLARTAGDPGGVVLAAQQELRRRQPDLVINATTGEATVENALAGQRNTARFLGVLGAIALLLAAIGIYGVMSYNVRQRNREISIRMALGAQRGAVLGMVLLRGMGLTVVGLAVGIAAALAVTRLMTQLLFVSPADPLAFAGTFVVLLVVALLACLAPALRASAVSPVQVLRSR